MTTTRLLAKLQWQVSGLEQWFIHFQTLHAKRLIKYTGVFSALSVWSLWLAHEHIHSLLHRVTSVKEGAVHMKQLQAHIAECLV